MAFSESGPATHSINVLGLLPQRGGTAFIGTVQNVSRPSPWDSWWCPNDGCSADLRVAAWI